MVLLRFKRQETTLGTARAFASKFCYHVVSTDIITCRGEPCSLLRYFVYLMELDETNHATLVYLTTVIPLLLI